MPDPSPLYLFLQRFAEGPYNLRTRVVLVVGLDEVPGRVLGAGTLAHVLHRDLIGLPLRAVAVVFSRDLIVLVTCLFALFEAPELFVTADMKPEFQYHDTVLDKLLLEIVDLRIRTHPLGLTGET